MVSIKFQNNFLFGLVYFFVEIIEQTVFLNVLFLILNSLLVSVSVIIKIRSVIART